MLTALVSVGDFYCLKCQYQVEFITTQSGVSLSKGVKIQNTLFK